MTRDMVGYGGKWPDMRWPNGAWLAVAVAVNFEEGAEHQVGDGDPQCEGMGEVISIVAPGVRDMGQDQIFAYGTRWLLAHVGCVGSSRSACYFPDVRSCR